jgi:hypothetical protein
MRPVIGRFAAIITAAIPGKSSAIREIDAYPPLEGEGRSASSGAR